MKKRAHRTPKLKKSIFLLPVIVLAISSLFNQISPFEEKNVQAIATNNEKTLGSYGLEETQVEENQMITVKEENLTKSIKNTEEVLVSTLPYEDENLKILLQNIQEEKNLKETNFSFFYYNLDKQTYYFYNEDTYFTAASTVKVPIAMLYYDKINQGNFTKDSKLLYTSNCYEAGSGTTASLYSSGQSVPLNFLLKQSIVNSDNTAVNILIRNLGQTQYRHDIAQYTQKELPEDFYSNNIISANYGYDVMNYLYKNQNQYIELLEDMKQSSMGQYLKKYIDNYEVAHKYGSYHGYVHDYGIVFGKQTYLIGIFTKNIANSDELIANISLEVLNYTLK